MGSSARPYLEDVRFLNLGSDVTELRILQIIIRAPALLLTSTFGSRSKFEIKQLSVKKTAAAKVAGSCRAVLFMPCDKICVPSGQLY